MAWKSLFNFYGRRLFLTLCGCFVTFGLSIDHFRSKTEYLSFLWYKSLVRFLTCKACSGRCFFSLCLQRSRAYHVLLSAKKGAAKLFFLGRFSFWVEPRAQMSCGANDLRNKSRLSKKNPLIAVAQTILCFLHLTRSISTRAGTLKVWMVWNFGKWNISFLNWSRYGKAGVVVDICGSIVRASHLTLESNASTEHAQRRLQTSHRHIWLRIYFPNLAAECPGRCSFASLERESIDPKPAPWFWGVLECLT